MVISQYGYVSALVPRTITHDRRLCTATVKPLRYALGLPWNTHVMSLMTEFNMLDPALRAEKAAANLYTTACLASAAEPENQEADELSDWTNPALRLIQRQCDLHQSEHEVDRPDPNSWVSRTIATPLGVRDWFGNTVIASDENMPKVIAQIYRRKAYAKLKSDKWGSPLKESLSSLFINTQAPIKAPWYHRHATLAEAQKVMACKLDTISPWRAAMKLRKKGDKRPSVPCPHCNTGEEARISHYVLSCPHPTPKAARVTAYWDCEEAGLWPGPPSFSKTSNQHFAGITPDQKNAYGKICVKHLCAVWGFLKGPRT